MHGIDAQSPFRQLGIECIHSERQDRIFPHVIAFQGANGMAQFCKGRRVGRHESNRCMFPLCSNAPCGSNRLCNEFAPGYERQSGIGPLSAPIGEPKTLAGQMPNRTAILLRFFTP